MLLAVHLLVTDTWKIWSAFKKTELYFLSSTSTIEQLVCFSHALEASCVHSNSVHTNNNNLFASIVHVTW